jgi:hydroxyacylglutathione hydrolase
VSTALAVGMLAAPSGADVRESDEHADLRKKEWNHGAADCTRSTEPAIETFRFSESTFVLRQSKCVDYEAPFVYVLFGEHTVLVQDTGATADAGDFPLYETVASLVSTWEESHDTTLRVVVMHSHSHGDHTSADGQFRSKPGVVLVEADVDSVHRFFGFANWPHESATLDLGKRLLSIIPAPGHHDEGVAVYDPQTKWLLTGDTVYPGHLYVKDWTLFQTTIARLVAFSKSTDVSAVMGSHIEMTRTPGRAYPPGSTYQPDEMGLALSLEDLVSLDRTLQERGPEPRQIVMDKFIVQPIGPIAKFLGWALGVLGFR